MMNIGWVSVRGSRLTLMMIGYGNYGGQQHCDLPTEIINYAIFKRPDIMLGKRL